MNLKYDTYVFDYYGTLLDSYNDEKSEVYWNKWLSVLDSKSIKHADCKTCIKDYFSMDKKYREIITRDKGYKYPEVDIIDVYRDFFYKYGNGILLDDKLYELAYDFRESTREYIRLYQGVDEYISKLRESGKKVYILSNAQRAFTWPEITMFDMHKKMDGVIMSSDYGCMKPETALFEVLFEKYGISKEGAVMIGDSIGSDIQGAKDFGIDYIHLINNNSADKFYLNELGA